jgi:hypothetical protein
MVIEVTIIAVRGFGGTSAMPDHVVRHASILFEL